MFRREAIILGSLSAVVFLAAALASGLVARSMGKDAAFIALDTLPGLVDTGAAIAQTQENWLGLHTLLGASSTAERTALIHRISTNSNEVLWKDYGSSVYNEEERETYQQLMRARAEFNQLRGEFFSRITSGQVDRASAFLSESLSPAYNRYLTLSRKLFQYNAAIGTAHARRVISLLKIIPMSFAATGVLLFSLGMVVGLRGALSGLALVTRISRPAKSKPVVGPASGENV